jgi:hypothetical protein
LNPKTARQVLLYGSYPVRAGMEAVQIIEFIGFETVAVVFIESIECPDPQESLPVLVNTSSNRISDWAHPRADQAIMPNPRIVLIFPFIPLNSMFTSFVCKQIYFNLNICPVRHQFLGGQIGKSFALNWQTVSICIPNHVL